jgi:hypothetical protein
MEGLGAMAAAKAEAQALLYLFSLSYFSSNYIKWYSTRSYSSIKIKVM